MFVTFSVGPYHLRFFWVMQLPTKEIIDKVEPVGGTGKKAFHAAFLISDSSLDSSIHFYVVIECNLITPPTTSINPSDLNNASLVCT